MVEKRLRKRLCSDMRIKRGTVVRERDMTSISQNGYRLFSNFLMSECLSVIINKLAMEMDCYHCLINHKKTCENFSSSSR